MRQLRNSRHHLIPQHWRELEWNNIPENIRQLTENFHRGFHTVFQDATPIQRLRMSLEADKQVLHPDVYLEISRVLQRFEKIEINVYDPRCFNSDKFMKKCHLNA